jgi:preprotein translocase subunit YajC
MLNYIILAETKSKGFGMDFMPLLLIMVVFFFFIIWPQMRKQKKAKAYMTQLKKGDFIVTTGGIHGKITSVADTHFVIEMEEGKMKVEKGAVSMEMTAAAYKQPKSAEAEQA